MGEKQLCQRLSACRRARHENPESSGGENLDLYVAVFCHRWLLPEIVFVAGSSALLSHYALDLATAPESEQVALETATPHFLSTGTAWHKQRRFNRRLRRVPAQAVLVAVDETLSRW